MDEEIGESGFFNPDGETEFDRSILNSKYLTDDEKKAIAEKEEEKPENEPYHFDSSKPVQIIEPEKPEKEKPAIIEPEKKKKAENKKIKQGINVLKRIREKPEILNPDAEKIIEEHRVKETSETLKDVFAGDNYQEVNPAIDFIDDNILFTTTLLQKPIMADSKKAEVTKPQKQPYVIMSGRRIAPITSNHIKDIGFLRLIPRNIEQRVSFKFVQDYTNGNLKDVYLYEVYDEILALIKQYIYFENEGDYSLIALWVIGTYYHRLFGSFPYLYLGGTKQTGKSKLLTLLSCLTFNGRLIVGSSVPALFRIIDESSATMLFDEEYKVASKEASDFRSIILSGYKMTDARTDRMMEVNRNGTKEYKADSYYLFSPKAFANIEGIDDVMEDRSVTIFMQRCDNPIIANAQIDTRNPVFQKLREKIYQVLLKNEYKNVVSVVCLSEKGYMDIVSSLSLKTFKRLDTTTPPNPIYNDTNDTNDTNTQNNSIETTIKTDENDSEVKENLFEESFSDISLIGRNFEIFSPLLALALAVDLDRYVSNNTDTEIDYENETELEKQIESIGSNPNSMFSAFFQHIISRVRERQSNEQENIDTERFFMLYKFVLKDGDGLYYVNDIVKGIKSMEKSSHTDRELDYYISARILGKFLRRYGLNKRKSRSAKGRLYSLNKTDIEKVASRYDIKLKKALEDFQKLEAMIHKVAVDDEPSDYHKPKMRGLDRYRKTYKDEYRHEEEAED